MQNIEEILKEIQNMDENELENAKKEIDDIIRRINELSANANLGGNNNE